MRIIPSRVHNASTERLIGSIRTFREYLKLARGDERFLPFFFELTRAIHQELKKRNRTPEGKEDFDQMGRYATQYGIPHPRRSG